MKKLIIALVLGLGIFGTAQGVGCPVSAGCTGQVYVPQGSILYGSSTNQSLNVLATGSAGSILSIVNNVPAWIATSTSGLMPLSTGTTGYVANWISNSNLSIGTLLDGSVAGVNATSSTVAFNIQGTGAIDPLQVGTSTDTSMFIVKGSTGRVGIGTTTPTVPLMVQGSSLGSIWTVNSTGASTFKIETGAGYTTIGTNTNDPLAMITNNAEVARLTAAGRVGIHDTTPDYMLETVGTSGSGFFGISSTTDGDILSVTSTGNVGIGVASPGTYVDISDPNSNTNSFRVSAPSGTQNGTIAQIRAGSTSSLYKLFSIDYGSGYALNAFTVKGAGFVGVATATPTARLHVTGSGLTSATVALEVDDASSTPIFYVRNDKAVGIGTSTLIAGGSLVTEAKYNTNVTSTRIMHSIQQYISPATDSSAVYQPFFVQGITDSDVNYTGIITAGNFTATFANLGIANNVTAGFYTAQNTGTGTATAITALNLAVKNTGTGTTTTATGLTIAPTASGGLMSKFIGVNVPATTQATTNYSALFGNNVGIGTTTPAYLLDINNGNATTTIQIDTTTSKGACLKLKDADGSGYTYCSVNNGTMTCSTGSCE